MENNEKGYVSIDGIATAIVIGVSIVPFVVYFITGKIPSVIDIVVSPIIICVMGILCYLYFRGLTEFSPGIIIIGFVLLLFWSICNRITHKNIVGFEYSDNFHWTYSDGKETAFDKFILGIDSKSLS